MLLIIIATTFGALSLYQAGTLHIFFPGISGQLCIINPILQMKNLKFRKASLLNVTATVSGSAGIRVLGWLTLAEHLYPAYYTLDEAYARTML